DVLGQGEVAFIAPFILDPNDSRRLLAGGVRLWRTNDATAEVTNEKGPEGRAIKEADGKGKNWITAIAVAPGAANVVWVGHRDGKVFATTNGTDERPKWEQKGLGQLPKGRWCNRIVVDPSNPKHVYVTFTGYAADNVWKTEDEGKTWQKLGPLAAQ